MSRAGGVSKVDGQLLVASSFDKNLTKFSDDGLVISREGVKGRHGEGSGRMEATSHERQGNEGKKCEVRGFISLGNRNSGMFSQGSRKLLLLFSLVASDTLGLVASLGFDHDTYQLDGKTGDSLLLSWEEMMRRERIHTL